MLDKYSNILVREKSAKELLKKKGFNNVEQVLDPTMLLSKEEWKKLTAKSRKMLNEKYIIIYQLHDNSEFDKYAEEFAKVKKMKLYRISPSIYHIFRSGKLIYLPNQYEFLKYFENAEYILTDSFHATVFSIIFNKKFIDILPNNKTGTRIESILSLLKIENRILKSFSDVNIIDKEIDWNEVNRIIEGEKIKSIKLLQEAISMAEEK